MNIKIGSSWVVNTEDGNGYYVLKDKSGKVTGFERMFVITENDNSKYNVDTFNKNIIPLGVIRKSIELMGLESSGRLNEIVAMI